jgi:predicted phosphodiesterase
MSKVLAIGDIHAPATRKGYLEFNRDLYEQWDCDSVVFLGDIVDWHAISFHSKNPECPGSRDEYELAKECVARWYNAFPKAKVCIGNHDELPRRQARERGIPDCLVRDYHEMWDTPGWDWDWKFTVDGTSFRHKPSSAGIHPAWNTMNKLHMSCCVGHCHSRAGIKWSCNENMRMFSMDVGCGIDERMWQFAYGRDMLERPFLSSGVIIDRVPYLEPMLCGPGEPYHDSRF